MATDAHPFVPRDVFRLLVRLEAQKSHDVDTNALEKRFRVPLGYSVDDTVEQRERRALSVTPGPGAYNVVQRWVHEEDGAISKLSAVFSSKAGRDPFQLKAIEKSKLVKPSASGARRQDRHANCCDHSASYLDKSPPLGSFTRADRGIASPTKSPNRSPPTNSASSHGDKTLAFRGGSFERARRATDLPASPDCALGPAQYQLQRLWDPSRKTGIATIDSPTSAVFGASKEKREVMWSPAHNLPTNALPEAWNTSKHYVKLKSRVVLETKQQRRKDFRQETTSLSKSRSVPVLRKETNSTPCGTVPDPFEWLRRRPHGEQRANALAVKHGLAELVRPTTAHSVTSTSHESVYQSHDNTNEDAPGPACQQQVGDVQAIEDDDLFSSRQTVLPGSNDGGHCTARDERITVSCRLQGGLVVTLNAYSAKKVRQLKNAIVRKQTRFQNEDQFDLYLGNGKQLTEMDATLQQAGLRDRSLVQLISR